MPRALLRAGAESVLTTLWPVSEKESAEMTSAFYKHWQSGDDKATALRKAEEEMRAAIMKHTGKDAPKKWAAWVLIGR